jgi:hypothetical protein
MPLEEFTDHFIGGMHWIYATTDVAEQDRRRLALNEFLEQRGAVLDRALEKLAQARAKYQSPPDSA